MAVSSTSQPTNIWIAAGDGDLERVKYLVDEERVSPNALDDNSYSPMHAAASYSQLDVLKFLVSKGGDVNLRDADNETPLFTCETLEVAQWLVEKGADVDLLNEDEATAGEKILDSGDFDDVGRWLISQQKEHPELPMPADIMAQVKEIMERHEKAGTSPDEELLAVVEGRLLNDTNFDLNNIVEGMDMDEGPDEVLESDSKAQE